MMRRILLWGYYGKGNFGDDLMLDNICSYLTSDITNQVTVLAADFEKIEVSSKNQIKIYQSYRNSKLKNLKLFWKVLRDNDFLVWGGGTCFSDEDGMPNILVLFIAKLLGVKVVFIGVGIGSVDLYKSRIKMKLISIITNKICLRDSESYRKAMKIFPARKVSLTEDLAYLYESDNEDVPHSDTSILTLSLRNLSNYLSEEDYQKFYDHFQLAVNNIIHQNLYNKITIIALDSDLDKEVNKKLYHDLHKKNGNKYEIEFICTESYEQKIAILKDSTFSIIVRLHGIFISELSNIPTIGISYSSKIDHFMNSIDSKGLINMNDVINSAEVIEKIYKELNLSLDSRVDIEKKLELSRNNFDFLLD